MPIRTMLLMAAVTMAAAACASAGGLDQANTAQPPERFQKVSDLVPLPEFIPGLGTLYVDPESLPAGPFLGYDRDGQLAATIYMTPLEALEGGTTYDRLAPGSSNVTSVDVYYNAGHPGVEQPHAHVVLFHDETAKGRLSESGQTTAISRTLDEDEVAEAPPAERYRQVSELVQLPDFLPGLGTLYVDPDTLPVGPFLGYDRSGELATTVYMTPLDDLANGAAHDNLAVGASNVSSVDIYYNAGHPGVEEPHAHVVLFHGDDARQRVEE